MSDAADRDGEEAAAAPQLPAPAPAPAPAAVPVRIGGITTGSLVDGRYEVLSLLAAGGQGAVYEVRDRRNGRVRALKVLLGHHLRDPALVERFRREATVTAQIESEHLVEVLDAGSDPESQLPYLVMERLRGQDLSRLLAERARLPWKEAVLYLAQTAIAIDKAHQAGILHRDLKPENLFLTLRDDGTPRIRVFDFGIAKTLDGTSAVNTQLVGTPLYMAPEQLRSEDKLTPGVDIFALGQVAFTLLVGREYWTTEAKLPVHALLLRLLQWLPDPPTARARALGAELPPSFDAWMLRACAPLPADRFATATAAVAALERVFEPLELEDALTRVQTGRTDDLPALVDDEGPGPEGESVGPESQTRLASSPHATGPLPEGSWPGGSPRATSLPDPSVPLAPTRRSTTASFASTSAPVEEEGALEVVHPTGRRYGFVALGVVGLGLALALTVSLGGSRASDPSTIPDSSRPATEAPGSPIAIAVTPHAVAPPPLVKRDESIVEARPVVTSAPSVAGPSGRPPPRPSPSATPAARPTPPVPPPSTAPPPPPAPPSTSAPPPPPPRRGID